MKRLFSISIILILSAVSLSACYGNNDIKVDNKFQCKTNDDCLVDDGYVCVSNLCVIQEPTAAGKCDDADNDGYGAPTTSPEGWKDCPVCKKDPSNVPACSGQLKDCAPGNQDIHPGVFDYCDGIDNNCNDKTDEDIKVCSSTNKFICNSETDWVPPAFKTGYLFGCFQSKQCVVYKKVSGKCHIYSCSKGTLVENSADTPCDQIKQ